VDTVLFCFSVSCVMSRTLGGPSSSTTPLGGRPRSTNPFGDGEKDSLLGATDGLSNRQLLGDRDRKLQEQDKALDVIMGSVKRQQDIAVQIGEETESQIGLLNQMEDKTVKQDGRVRKTTEGVEVVEANSSTKMLWAIICILLFLFIGVCFLAVYV